jgi:hypothetical protein
MIDWGQNRAPEKKMPAKQLEPTDKAGKVLDAGVMDAE